MAKEKVEKKEEETIAGFYKGYDIRWLKRDAPNHPDFHLVAEYEAKFGEVK